MITIELPWIDTILLPNEQDGILKFGTRKAQYAVTTARDQAKSDAYYLALQVYNQSDYEFSTTSDLNVSIEYNPPPRVRPDFDGVTRALKPMLDGIAMALRVNDYHFNPVRIYRGAHVDGGRVTVIIDDLPF